jgi:hypothetical protein
VCANIPDIAQKLPNNKVFDFKCSGPKGETPEEAID